MTFWKVPWCCSVKGRRDWTRDGGRVCRGNQTAATLEEGFPRSQCVGSSGEGEGKGPQAWANCPGHTFMVKCPKTPHWASRLHPGQCRARFLPLAAPVYHKQGRGSATPPTPTGWHPVHQIAVSALVDSCKYLHVASGEWLKSNYAKFSLIVIQKRAT